VNDPNAIPCTPWLSIAAVGWSLCSKGAPNAAGWWWGRSTPAVRRRLVRFRCSFSFPRTSCRHARRARRGLPRTARPPFYVGVPNRHRIVGYVGSFDAATWQKITWNINDWGARLTGRFRNGEGSHAGFTQEELLNLCGESFTDVECLTREFLRLKYGGRLPGPLLDILLSQRLLDYCAPSVYALCRRCEE